MTVKIRPGTMKTNMINISSCSVRFLVTFRHSSSHTCMHVVQGYLIGVSVPVSLLNSYCLPCTNTISLCPFHCVTLVMCCRSDAVQLSDHPSDLVHSLALSDR